MRRRDPMMADENPLQMPSPASAEAVCAGSMRRGSNRRCCQGGATGGRKRTMEAGYLPSLLRPSKGGALGFFRKDEGTALGHRNGPDRICGKSTPDPQWWAHGPAHGPVRVVLRSVVAPGSVPSGWRAGPSSPPGRRGSFRRALSLIGTVVVATAPVPSWWNRMLSCARSGFLPLRSTGRASPVPPPDGADGNAGRATH